MVRLVVFVRVVVLVRVGVVASHALGGAGERVVLRGMRQGRVG